VYTHELGTVDNAYDIDTPSEQYYAYHDEQADLDVNLMNRKVSFTREKYNTWTYSKLTDEEKRNWDTFTPEMKATILGQHCLNAADKRKHPLASRIAKNHDFSIKDLLTALLHEQRLGSEGDIDDSTNGLDVTKLPDDDPDGESTEILAHVTQRKKASPGHIAKVLSSSAS
jgi:hypothetical protein